MTTENKGGTVVPFPDRMHRSEAETPFRTTVPLRIPRIFDVNETLISIQPSVENAGYTFHMTPHPDRPLSADSTATKDDYLRALRFGDDVSFGLEGQTLGDTVTVVYTGPLAERNGALAAKAITYRYTQDRGWRSLKGALTFAAKNGAGLHDITITEPPQK